MSKTEVLLVEDDKILVEMYLEAFKLEGFSTEVANNGQEGLLAIKKIKPNIILLDVLMPGMNGFEFLKEIKTHNELSDVPVLLLTNLGEDKIDLNKDLAFVLGIEGYLIKAKHTPDEVVERIKITLKNQEG